MSIAVTPGTGATVATEVISAVQYPQVKLLDATVGSTAATGVAANPLQVSLANTGANSTPIAVSATTLPLPSGASTAAKQPALGTAGTPSADVITVQGNASGTPIPVSNASLPLPTGASTSANQSTGNTSLSSIDTKTPALGQALAAASVPVILPTATITTLTPPTTITANAGTGNFTVTQATGTNLHTVVDSGTITTVSAVTAITNPLPSGTNVIGHVISDTGSTTVVTGTVAVTESGTWTVQPGNTANTTPWLTSSQAPVAGGWTPYTYLSTASTNATSLKGSAGNIGNIQVFNNTATIGYLKIFNKASAPTVGTDTPVKNILIPANTSGAGASISLGDAGISFGTGIAFAVTGGAALLDATATAANAFLINIDYK